MAIKNILVPVFADDSNSSALEVASVVAHLFGAHIEALYVKRRSLQFQYSGMSSSVVQELRTHTQEVAEQADIGVRDRFDEVVAKRSLQVCDDPNDADGPSASWQEVDGDKRAVLSERGIVFDLVVVNRPNQGREPDAMELVEAALFGTRRPVLVAPPVFNEQTTELSAGGWRIVIGWNKTAQSGIAISNAAPFVAHSDAVEVFSVATGAKLGPGVNEAARYLGWHGAKASIKEVEPNNRVVGARLLTEAGDFGADLLVMGAYSHSRLRERIWGGVTRYVLENSNMPVLMIH